MNYRHAFHAGNFADVFKHVLLSRILVYLTRKAAPIRYIDTHAGIGLYDLAGEEATRTGEWRTGVGRLETVEIAPDLIPLLTPYREALGSRLGDGRPVIYPGSPAIAQHLLRPTDRLTLVERHAEDAVRLKTAMGRDKRVKVMAADGYTSLNACVPPPERRGLVLIDPPFEERDEFNMLAEALTYATRKWATGTYAVWYPIKELAPITGFHKQMRALGLAQHCTLEILRDDSPALPGLRGCGLFVINPPYILAQEAGTLLPYLCQAFSDPGQPPFRATIREQDGIVRRL